MVTEMNIIGIHILDFQKYGCPHCGYRSGSFMVGMDGSTTFECCECEKTSVLLGEGIEISSIGFGDPPVYPTRKKHPLHGIPAHGNADVKPPKGGEFYDILGTIGEKIECGCYICGQENMLHDCISGFVRTRESGKRVLNLFEVGKAFLDYSPKRPDRTEVKIGACDKHQRNLTELHRLIRQGNTITKEKIYASMIAKR